MNKNVMSMPKRKEQGTVQDYERQLKYVAQRIYDLGERRIEPTWPWVLIRAVPKEQKFGSLYLPDNDGQQKQHKPLLEGIVLATWKSHWSKFRKPGVESTTQEIWRESEFQVGDRVLYPHFAGLPVNFLDEQHYRLIREWTFDEMGGVLCKLEYDGDKKIKRDLDKLLKDLQSITLSGK